MVAGAGADVMAFDEGAFVQAAEAWLAMARDFDDATENPKNSQLDARTPDRFNLSLESTVEGGMLALGVNSPCRRSPTKLW